MDQQKLKNNELQTKIEYFKRDVDELGMDKNLILEIKLECQKMFEDYSDNDQEGAFKDIVTKLYDTLLNDVKIEFQFQQESKHVCNQIIDKCEQMDSLFTAFQQNENNIQITKKDLEVQTKQLNNKQAELAELEQQITIQTQENINQQQKGEKKLVQIEFDQLDKIRQLEQIKQEQEQMLINYEEILNENKVLSTQEKIKLEETFNLNYQLKQDQIDLSKSNDIVNNDIQKLSIVIEDKEQYIQSTNEQIEDTKNNKQLKISQIKQNKHLFDMAEKNYHDQKYLKESALKDIRNADQEIENITKRINRDIVQNTRYENDIIDLKEIESKVQDKLNISKQDLNRTLKFYKVFQKKTLEKENLKSDLERRQAEINEQLQLEQESHGKILQIYENFKKDLQDNRNILQDEKTLLINFEKTQIQESQELIEIQNHLKNTENLFEAVSIESQKIQTQIAQLSKDQEKYGIQASEAHAKYYQTIEEAKIKNNTINELKKKNLELETKTKYQQQLYEAVRADRSKYGKQLHESQTEIYDLTQKNTRFSHQIDKYKEEIKQKDVDLLNEDIELNKIQEDNQRLYHELERCNDQTQASESLIKTQLEHIQKLEKLISISQSEKQDQQQTVSRLIKEKQLLYQQMIEKQGEKKHLLEKKSRLQDQCYQGTTLFAKLQRELKDKDYELKELNLEHQKQLNNIQPITLLLNEIASFEKDLANTLKRQSDLKIELEHKMNIHRWRKLDALESESYSQIVNIQNLQRNLIKNQSQIDKMDEIIKEKEGMFEELKKIMQRQPGLEIHQQLEIYKQILKDKINQVKKMNLELEQSKDTVDIYMQENQRLRNEIQQMKQVYIQNRIKNELRKSVSERVDKSNLFGCYDHLKNKENDLNLTGQEIK